MVQANSTQENYISDEALVRQHLDRINPPDVISSEEANFLQNEIKELIVAKKAKVVAHYYTDSALQDLAESTGGYVGDSLKWRALVEIVEQRF